MCVSLLQMLQSILLDVYLTMDKPAEAGREEGKVGHGFECPEEHERLPSLWCGYTLYLTFQA